MTTANSRSSDNQYYRWVILGSVFLVQCIVSLMLFSFGPLAPFLRDEFHLTRVQTGMFFSLAYSPTMILGLFGGWLVDRWGVRRFLLFGGGTFAVFYIIFSLISNITLGYFIAFLMGIGFMFVTPTTTVALVHWFPVSTRATAMGIKQSAVTVGSAIGAIVIPILCLAIGWRYAISICGSMAVVLVIISYFIYRESSTKPIITQPPICGSIRRVLGNKRLLFLSISCAIFAALQMGVSNYLVLEMVEVRQLSEIAAGTFLMLINLGGVAGRVFWGTVSDRVFKGRRSPVLAIIGVSSGIIAIFISFSGATISFWLLYIIIAMLGVTALGWNSVFLTFASELSEKETTAMSIGWAMTIVTFGSVLGPPAFGYIVDMTSSYSPAWFIFGVLVTTAALFIVLIGKFESEKQTSQLQ